MEGWSGDKGDGEKCCGERDRGMARVGVGGGGVGVWWGGVGVELAS